jgi:hypothetical protein
MPSLWEVFLSVKDAKIRFTVSITFKKYSKKLTSVTGDSENAAVLTKCTQAFFFFVWSVSPETVEYPQGMFIFSSKVCAFVL